MEYFKILHLEKEPFSNSPDPDYFFKSRHHNNCLQKLELAIRLRRGLSVVIGEVGTGKTTLCRQLLRKLSNDGRIQCHLILDPAFTSPNEFLSTVAQMIVGDQLPADSDERQYKEAIKTTLFQKGVDQDNYVVIVIDEGQKIPAFSLEILRELLNYETNQYKLLQIVIFAQLEFHKIINKHANFADRINLLYPLVPMGFKDTRRMIEFRLQQAGKKRDAATLFTIPAYWAIFRASKGYPRKIINLCHQSILAMIIQNRTKAGWRLVRSCVKRAISTANRRTLRYSMALFLIGATATFATIVTLLPGQLTRIISQSGIPDTAPIISGLDIENITENQRLALNSAKDNVFYHFAPSPNPSGRGDSRSMGLNIMAEVRTKPESHTNNEPMENREKSVGNIPVAPSTPNINSATLPAQPPAALGTATIKDGDTLSYMIRIIYGSFQPFLLRSVLEINPHIRNPDNVKLGQKIIFPALPVIFKETNLRQWWIQIDQTHNLEAAMQWITASDNLPPLQLVPSWSKETGIEFSIIMERHFFNEEIARTQLESLSSHLEQPGIVLAGWDSRKTYYADPYRNQ